jgi:hypothetical protein
MSAPDKPAAYDEAYKVIKRSLQEHGQYISPGIVLNDLLARWPLMLEEWEQEEGPANRCKNCGEAIHLNSGAWIHVRDGFWCKGLQTKPDGYSRYGANPIVALYRRKPTAPTPTESFEERVKRIADEHRGLLEDPRMADDYNPDTRERDGIPYWERTTAPTESSE